MHLLLTWIAIRSRVKYESTQMYKGAIIKCLLQHTLSEWSWFSSTCRNEHFGYILGTVKTPFVFTTGVTLCFLVSRECLRAFCSYSQSALPVSNVWFVGNCRRFWNDLVGAEVGWFPPAKIALLKIDRAAIWEAICAFHQQIAHSTATIAYILLVSAHD
jgi:hypothetical protein